MPASKRSFTLVEVSLCVVILAFISGVVAIRGREMIDRYRFKNEVEQLVALLNATRDLAFLTDNYLSLKLKIDKRGLRGERFYTAEPPQDQKNLYKKVVLKTLSHCCLDHKKKRNIDLDFTQDGWVIEGKTLHLSYKGKYHCYIDLEETPFFKQRLKPFNKACSL